MPFSSAPIPRVSRDKDPSLKTLLIQEALRARSLYNGPLDNDWGKGTEAAYQTFLSQHAEGVHNVIASTFADPTDVRRFKACKASGKSDKECFKVGDNGIGYFDSYDTTTDEPQCALHVDIITERWGSVAAGKFKQVNVTYRGNTQTCKLTDICGKIERIDLNPGACRALGFPIGGLDRVMWQWADGAGSIQA